MKTGDILKLLIPMIFTIVSAGFGLYVALEHRIDEVERHIDRLEYAVGVETDGET